MTKVVPASCQSGNVTIDGKVVPGVILLCEGVGASTGIALIDLDKISYIALTSPDLKSTISDVVTALQACSSGLNAAGGALNGIAPGSGSGVISAAGQVDSAVSTLNTLKGQLK